MSAMRATAGQGGPKKVKANPGRVASSKPTKAKVARSPERAAKKPAPKAKPMALAKTKKPTPNSVPAKATQAKHAQKSAPAKTTKAKQAQKAAPKAAPTKTTKAKQAPKAVPALLVKVKQAPKIAPTAVPAKATKAKHAQKSAPAKATKPATNGQNKKLAFQATPPAKAKPGIVESAKTKVKAQAALPSATTVVTPPKSPQEGSMHESAKRGARASDGKATVVRIAGALRRPRVAAAEPPPAERPTEPARVTKTIRREAESEKRIPGPRIEVNPKLQSSKDLVKAAPKPEGEKPMSVAEKHRAAAEAMFARLRTGAEPPPPSNGSAEAPLPYAARKQEDGGGSYTMRVSEFDSLSTNLRLASSKDEALSAARELADRFKLPMDQSLLLKVVSLEDRRLTKLALEELLELEDRGRVRPTPELKRILGDLVNKDPDIQELRALLLEKIRV